MLFNSLRAGGGLVEIEQIVCRLTEPLDAGRLLRSLRWSLDRHEVLRTAFRWQGLDEPRQRLTPCEPPALAIVSHEHLDSTTQEAELARFLDEDRAQGFELDRAPLTRWTLFVRGPRDHVLVWTFHHALLDGRSFTRVLRETFEHYDATGSGQSYSPHPLPPFRAYCQQLAGRDRGGEAEYWRDQLADLDGGTPLPYAQRARAPLAVSTQHAEHHVRVTRATVEKLTKLTASSGATLANALQAAWALVLARHARSSDVCFGSTRAGRSERMPGARDVVGCLINTLPLRVRVPEDADLRGWLAELRALNLAMRPFEQSSLTEIRHWAGWPAAVPVFETLLVFERYLLDSALGAAGGPFAQRRFSVHAQSDFALALVACEDQGELVLRLEFDPARCAAHEAAQLLRQICALLANMAEKPDGRVRDLGLLSPADVEASLALAGGTQAAAPFAHGSVVPLLHGRAAHSPDAPAVRAGASVLSFRELERRALAIACALRAAGVARGDVVAVVLARSPELVSALWGVLAVGAVYLPIDPGWPEERIATILDDAQAACVLTDASAHWAVPAGVSAPRLRVETAQSGEFAPVPLASDQPAYLIYTSGSTGRPKGVAVGHGALLAHASAFASTFGLGASDRCLQFTSPAFDVSLEEIFPTLLAGASVVLGSERAGNSLDAFIAELAQQEVTVLNLPSAFFAEVARYLLESGQTLPASVRLLLVGGERPSAAAYASLRARHPQLRFVNAYGPTETAITCTYCDPVEAGVPADGESELPIGIPLGATRAYVLDEAGQLLPPGVVGELYVGGPQVGLGYLHRPELTAQKFLPDPFRPDARVFRTGDLVLRLPSGQLLFRGRRDEQVKIRGFRVEPGEIEALLASDPRVRSAAVAARPDKHGGLRLVAWLVVPNEEARISGAIERDLAKQLPSYMLPSAYAYLDELPVTKSGKVDRRLLADPEQTPAPTQSVDPSSELEFWLASQFAEVLGRKHVGPHDNFFELGGHSLLALRLLSRVNARAHEPLPLSALFEKPTLRALAGALEAGGVANAPALIQLNRSDSQDAPFFCICGVQLYARLARAMSKDRPVFGTFLPIEADLRAGGQALDVRTMAASYGALIKTRQPRGPYLLGGVSFGGLLAYEIAQQLRASGEEVSLLVLFDTILPRAARARAPAERMRAALERVAEDPRRAGRELAQRVARRLSAWRAGALANRDEPSEHELHEVRDQLFLRASRAYEAIIRPYPGRVLMFAATDRSARGAALVAPDRGWSGLLRADTTTHAIAGTHLGILSEPEVLEVARHLCGELTRVAPVAG